MPKKRFSSRKAICPFFWQSNNGSFLRVKKLRPQIMNWQDLKTFVSFWRVLNNKIFSFSRPLDRCSVRPKFLEMCHSRISKRRRVRQIPSSHIQIVELGRVFFQLLDNSSLSELLISQAKELGQSKFVDESSPVGFNASNKRISVQTKRRPPAKGHFW